MSEEFHFSPRSNQASEIVWRGWTREAFDDAARLGRPVFLNLSAVWCHWCHEMDETTFSDPAIIELINRETVPVRVDADRNPHVQERYIAGGWPTNAFLTPTGEVLWSATYVDAEQLRTVAAGVLEAWRSRREELESQIRMRQKAMQAARSRRPSVGIVRREAADDVLSAVQQEYDSRNGGFGAAPKFPQPEALELLMLLGTSMSSQEWLGMAERTLDGMLAGELWDDVEGGFYRYATQPDWTEPHHEKMLDVNASLLRVYALAAHVWQRDDYRTVAERTVQWVNARLQLRDGLWGGSQDADAEYALLDAEARAARTRPYVDEVVYASWNGAWIRALADAGARLGNDAWIEAAATSLRRLLETMRAADGLPHHYRVPDGQPSLPGLLTDCVELAAACCAVAQAAGDESFLDAAIDLMRAAEKELWAEEGGFFDSLPDDSAIGALRYRDRPFEANALAARVLIDLYLATGDRHWRALAERTLAVLSPVAARYGVAGAPFAIAVEEFFESPLRVVVIGTGPEADALRRAALALPRPGRRVWRMSEPRRIGSLDFRAGSGPVAYVCGARSCSRPTSDPAELAPLAEAAH